MLVLGWLLLLHWLGGTTSHFTMKESCTGISDDFSSGEDYRYPLHLASLFGRPDVIEKLLDCGANIEERDSWGMTALHWAAFAGQDEAILKLLEKGAYIDPIIQSGKTPLH